MDIHEKSHMVWELNSQIEDKEKRLYVIAPASLRKAKEFILETWASGVIADEFYTDQILTYWRRYDIPVDMDSLEIFLVENYGVYSVEPTISLFEGDAS